MASTTTYPTVIASDRWRGTDFTTLEAITSIVYRNRLGRVDFLLGPGRAVIVDRSSSDGTIEEGLREHLVKLQTKSSALQRVVIISESPSVDLQLMCHRLGFRVLPTFGESISNLLVHLIKASTSDPNNFFPKITSAS